MSQVKVTAKPSEMSVAIGFPCGASLPWQTAISLMETTRACAKQGIPFNICLIAGSSIITEARSRVVDAFLKTEMSRLFWIDSDMQWNANDFVRFLVLSTEMDVVVGAYPLKREGSPLVISHPDLKNFEINKYGCIKINGIGMGFSLMKREVVERVAATKPLVYDAVRKDSMRDVFRLDTVPGPDGRVDKRGEDVAFWSDVRALGYDIWLDPSVKLGHVGNYVYQQEPIAALGLEEAFEKLSQQEK